MTAAAGAAVVIVAGVTVPQLAGSFGGSQPGPPAARVKTIGPAPKPAPGALSVPGPSLSTMTGRPGVVAGFRPLSVTFVGPTTGAVLGHAGSCAARPCTAIAGTHDYGKSWSEIGAPPAGPPAATTGVSQIRLLNLHDGWVYGPALFATHNGGRSWHPIRSLPGRVIDLSAVGRRAFAVVASGCTGTGAQFAAGCTGFSLYSAKGTSDQWRPVPGASGSGRAVAGGLQLTGQGGYLLVGRHLYAGPVTGAAWHPVPARAATTPACLASRASGSALIAPLSLASGASDLFLVCRNPAATGLTLYRSGDGGSTWQSRGAVSATGTAASLAVSPAGTLVLATDTGIYRSADARTWKRAGVTAPAGGFSFVGMTDRRTGRRGPRGACARGLHHR